MGNYLLDTDETAQLIRSAADQIEGGGMTPNTTRDRAESVANRIENIDSDGEEVPRSVLESAQTILRLGASTAEMYVEPHVSPSLYRERATRLGTIIYGSDPPIDNPGIAHKPSDRKPLAEEVDTTVTTGALVQLLRDRCASATDPNTDTGYREAVEDIREVCDNILDND